MLEVLTPLIKFKLSLLLGSIEHIHSYFINIFES